MCSHIDAIEQFVEYFQDQKALISQVQPNLYRKVIYATALDPIARAAFGKVGQHRAKSLRLIDELTNWTDRDRVSLPQLCLALEEKGLISGFLYAEAKTRLEHWAPGEVLRLNNSPLLPELMPVAQPLEKCVLLSCRYAELFYTYRNNLVHEFREPGYGIEMSSDKDQPYYHSMIGDTWQLVFPVGFFARLYAEALVGLRALLVRGDIDPYCQFEFGSKWRAH
ncbi:hypothetical protein MIZ03_4631 [Rhodoferax lithotrophicus]|uniref:Uncharacterized protein n=1 Tax=Rhodoferax lithotrophicus TaxID=2798804 RepID=A0ABM7MTI2_9BURK|nr:hypothetical protein [Rhodoferax sp. MIZ03]BCO29707.1 hypothetical protein MIZ03_4631 [Rhodoferax sp. MIZ03]